MSDESEWAKCPTCTATRGERTKRHDDGCEIRRLREEAKSLRAELLSARDELHGWRDTAECDTYMELATKMNEQDARLLSAREALRAAEVLSETRVGFMRWLLEESAQWPGKGRPCTECHCGDATCSHDCDLTRALSPFPKPTRDTEPEDA